jgi:O-methyltransferase
MWIALKKILKLLVPPILPMMVVGIANYRKNAARRGTPDIKLYKPLFSPWLLLPGEIADYKQIKKRTIISDERLYVLRWAARQALRLQPANSPVCWFELGVYKGGTAGFLADLAAQFNKSSPKHPLKVRLFDTFEGMPETNQRYDYHQMGDFSDTSLEAVQRALGEGEHVYYHPGLIPETFGGLENDRLSFVHVDVDIYQSVLDGCEFVYQRLVPGGIMIFDDYGFPSCPGARKAVDMFFADKEEEVLVLSAGQAMIIEL